MDFKRITAWLDRTLDVDAFDDASNNGVQIARSGGDVTRVAFGVDASVETVARAAARGAQLLVVHHGISWGGGIKRLAGGVYNVVRAAMAADLALYAAHLPLDANRRYGHNWTLARKLGLKGVTPAFSYRGRAIGVTGTDARGRKIGVCSGGAGEFAEEAKALGCDVYVTGEANWGETVAARNCGMPMLQLGHYETETVGLVALAAAMARALRVETEFLDVRDGLEAEGKGTEEHEKSGD